jgi:hypothetical protein
MRNKAIRYPHKMQDESQSGPGKTISDASH